ncbi:hypothetical protein DL89DRAFT_295163 [Linderina pennispora]|uniref:F-box domain-containing protein n=1 Tax=Linderina pennispora TaxID=61395 RepID=A0A1Y1W0K0_9FUNG|nr:uncharacterized protein DL89DRAFT_295163 [Linderina pennispora]ORX66786.1 hypothetical protein DL89DRAFT_295163 [Linderina pennispora]
MEELDKFREQWLEEVRTRHEPATQTASELLSMSGVGSMDANTQTALSHYLQATAYEHEGRLGEALGSYRKAFRHCATIDSIYRQITQGRDGAHAQAQLAKAEQNIADKRRQESGGFLFRHEAGAREVDDTRIDVMAELVSGLKKMELQCVPGNANRPVLVDRLPDDLLVHVLKMAGAVDVQIVGRFAAACKRFAVVSRDARLWKFMNCAAQRQPTGERFQAACSSVSVPAEEPVDTYSLYREAQAYDGWLDMFLRRARVRFDGIYISTCHYLRPSSAENTWTTPVMLVTYYRYLRFFRDGTCLKLLSTTEPAKIVRSIFWATRERRVQRGVWRLDGRDVVAYTQDKERDGLTFCLELEVRSTRDSQEQQLQ